MKETEEAHYFLKNIPIISANGYAIDIWRAFLINREMQSNVLFAKTTEWIRQKQTDPSSLLRSVKDCDIKGVLQALDCGISTEVEDFKGRTALHLSTKNCSRDGLRILELLLVRNANVNSRDSTRFRRTPLHSAVKSNNFDAVQLLLDEKCAIDNTDACGRTALVCACEYKNDEMIELLLNYGADPNVCDMYGNSPLLLLMKNRDERISDEEEFWRMFGTWGGRDYEQEML
jgi:ankyrin repeat protein